MTIVIYLDYCGRYFINFVVIVSIFLWRKTEIIISIKRYDSLKFHPIAFAMTDTLITVIPIFYSTTFLFAFLSIKLK